MEEFLKKFGAFVLSTVVVLSLAACEASADTTSSSESEAITTNEKEIMMKTPVSVDSTEAGNNEEQSEPALDDVQTDETNGRSNILVVYFSRTGEQYSVGVIDKGNTAIVADMIVTATGADSFEILPEKDYYPYTYDELTDVAKKEQSEGARPAYTEDVPDLSQYSTIFIGAPVWWGDWPMICYTFFEENADAFSGKNLIPFSTHEGSGLSGFDRKLSSACPNSTVGKGLAIRGKDAQKNQDSVRNTVNDWLSGLGY